MKEIGWEEDEELELTPTEAQIKQEVLQRIKADHLSCLSEAGNTTILISVFDNRCVSIYYTNY